MPAAEYKPGASSKDDVRFEIQDTDPDNQEAWLLQDAEIERAIELEAPGAPPLAEDELLSSAARCLEALSRRFAAQADVQLGTLHETYSKAAEGYSKRASELRERAGSMHAPMAGGTSESEKEALAEETDRVQPLFSKGQWQNPYTGPQGIPTTLIPGEGIRGGQ